MAEFQASGLGLAQGLGLGASRVKWAWELPSMFGSQIGKGNREDGVVARAPGCHIGVECWCTGLIDSLTCWGSTWVEESCPRLARVLEGWLLDSR